MSEQQSLVEWLKVQIEHGEETLRGLDRGVRHLRGVSGEEMVDVTDEYRAEVESRIERNSQLLRVING